MNPENTLSELDGFLRELAGYSHKLSDLMRRAGSRLDPFPGEVVVTHLEEGAASELFAELVERSARFREAVAITGFSCMPQFPSTHALAGMLLSAMQAKPEQWQEWEFAGQNWAECYSSLMNRLNNLE